MFFRDTHLCNLYSTSRIYEGSTLLASATLDDMPSMEVDNSFSAGDADSMTNFIIENLRSVRGNSRFIPLLAKQINKGLEFFGADPSSTASVNKGVKGIEKFSNKALIASATRLKFFDGTEVKFTLSIDGVIYHGDHILNANEKPKVVTNVYEEIASMNSRFGGGAVASGQVGTVLATLLSITNSGLLDLTDYFNSSISIQDPPHGYTAVYGEGGTVSGTLTAQLGKTAKITNLVCDSFKYTFSKEMTLDAFGNRTPLYCKYSIELSPASLLSKGDVLSFFNPSNFK